MAYVPIDRFLVRAPLLATTPLADAARRLMRDPLGARALALASESLAAQTGGSRAAQAIDRYGRRAAFRATPAGLLAGVTVGTLGARTGGATGTPRAHLATSWARIARLARALLEDPEVRDQVHLRAAPSLLRGADRVRWLAGGAGMAEEREADLDARLARILDACGDWTPWPALRAAAAGIRDSDGVVVPLHPPARANGAPLDDDGGADADELLLLLLDDELLCCDLTPPLVGPPAARWMSDRLAALRPPPPEAAILARAGAALDAGDLDAGRAALRELPGEANLDSESDGSADGDRSQGSGGASDLVATLVHQPEQALTLERATVERAARLAPLLFRLQDALAPPAAERDGDPHALEALADAAELFGEGTLDAGAWALGDYGVDPSAGEDDGPPGGRSAAPPPALVRLLVDEIAAARAAQRAEIALDAAALDRLLPAAAPPATCELFLTPAPPRTAWLLGVHAPAGASWGRFAHALGSDFADAFAALDTVERAAQPHQSRLDVAYAPAPAVADLCAHPPLRDGVLALSGWPEPARDDGARGETPRTAPGGFPEARQPAQLGLVAASGVAGLAVAAAGRTDDGAPEEVVPSPLARVRSTTAPAGLYRMLAGFSLYRQHAPWALSLGALADLAHVPRVSIDGFVVSPASWRLPGALDARALRRWRRGGAGAPPLPRFVQVGVEDQLLPVDLDRPQAWRDLSGQPRAWEIWPPLSEDQPDNAGGRQIPPRARHAADAGPHRRPRRSPHRSGGCAGRRARRRRRARSRGAPARDQRRPARSRRRASYRRRRAGALSHSTAPKSGKTTSSSMQWFRRCAARSTPARSTTGSSSATPTRAASALTCACARTPPIARTPIVSPRGSIDIWAMRVRRERSRGSRPAPTTPRSRASAATRARPPRSTSSNPTAISPARCWPPDAVRATLRWPLRRRTTGGWTQSISWSPRSTVWPPAWASSCASATSSRAAGAAPNRRPWARSTRPSRARSMPSFARALGDCARCWARCPTPTHRSQTCAELHPTACTSPPPSASSAKPPARGWRCRCCTSAPSGSPARTAARRRAPTFSGSARWKACCAAHPPRRAGTKSALMPSPVVVCMMARMGVGRAVRARKSAAAALILVGAPIWLLGATASAQPAPKHDEWPNPPPESPPVTQRLWPPPEPPRRPRVDPSTDEATPDDDASAVNGAPEPPPPPPTAPAPAPVTPPADPNQITDPNQIAVPLAPAAAAPKPPPQAAPPPNGVYVELRSDDPGMRIDQLTPGGQSWPACEIPCRRVLQRNITYVVESNQSPATSPFLLPDNVNRLTLDVQAGSQTRANVGTILAVVGGVVGLIGFIRLTTTGSSPQTDRTGLELLGVGAAVGISGIVIFRMSRTTVTSSTGSTFSKQHDRGARAAPSIALTPQGLVF